MIAQDAQGKRYIVVKWYRFEGRFVERVTARRYDLVKRYL